jgi:hypothetical protein
LCHKQKSKAALLVPSTTASAADDVISLAMPEALSAMMPSMTLWARPKPTPSG